ncbi:unnamed protein product [Caenorhabditis brenneri]
MTFPNLLIIGIAVLGVVSATNVTKVELTGNCNITELIYALSCAQTMKDFKDRMSPSTLSNTTELSEFKGSCATLEKCHTTIGHCPPFGTNETHKAFRTITSYCGVINTVADNLLEYGDLLEKDEVSKKCYNEWKPFLKAGDEAKDKTETCKNFFGKDQCMKISIIKHCGQENWEKFRDAFIELNNAVQQCDLSNVL